MTCRNLFYDEYLVFFELKFWIKKSIGFVSFMINLLGKKIQKIN